MSLADDPTWGGRAPHPITTALRASSVAAEAPLWLTWRTGRKVGRTLYAQVRDEPSGDDILIGLMDTERLAVEVVSAHNAVLEQVQR